MTDAISSPGYDDHPCGGVDGHRFQSRLLVLSLLLSDSMGRLGRIRLWWLRMGKTMRSKMITLSTIWPFEMESFYRSQSINHFMVRPNLSCNRSIIDLLLPQDWIRSREIRPLIILDPTRDSCDKESFKLRLLYHTRSSSYKGPHNPWTHRD